MHVKIRKVIPLTNLKKLVENRSGYFVLFASLILLSLLIAMNWSGIIDDAYIFLRYAYNIAHGIGYVFNPGEHVEGTTSLTWTLLLASLSFFNIPLEPAVKILSFLCILAVITLMWRAFYRKGVQDAVTLLILALLITDKSFNPSIMMGLETGLYTFLLVAFCLLAARTEILLKHPTTQPRSPYMLGIVGVLLYLTRPEAIVLLFLIVFGFVIFNRMKAPIIQDSLITLVIWFTGILLASFWRLWLFGDFIPNSARAKSVIGLMLQDGSVLWSRLVFGGKYIAGFFYSSWPLILLGVIGLVLLFKRSPFQGYVFGAILLSGIMTALINSGDWMPHFRLLTPTLSILALLAGIGFRNLHSLLQAVIPSPAAQKEAQVINHSRIKSASWQNRLSPVLVLLAALVYAIALISAPFRGLFVTKQWPKAICYTKSGQALRPYLTAKTTIAPEAIGAISFQLIDVRVLDFFGLTDSFIAHNGVIPIETYMMGKHHYEYVMQREPDIFFFHSDLINHIPLLNQWGYSEKYDTFELLDEECNLYIGMKRFSTVSLLPVLESSFGVQLVDTAGLPKNTAATWPEGER